MKCTVTLLQFGLLWIITNLKTAFGSIKRDGHAVLVIGLQVCFSRHSLALGPFHAPAEPLYVLNVNLMAAPSSKLEEPQCFYRSVPSSPPCPPSPSSQSKQNYFSVSLSGKQREVTAVISFAWLKADRVTGPVRLDMFESRFSI